MGEVIHMKRERDNHLAQRIRRAEAIRDAIKRREVFSADDQVRSARNLHRLLERAKKSASFDVHNVLSAKGVGLGGNGRTDSTKRLDTYTLPPNADENRVSRIAKKPRKFWEIAKAVAAELDEPEAVLVSQVFEGCSFGTSEMPKGDWNSENWSRLAEQIKLMSDAVIRDFDVETYWKKVFSTNGRYDVFSGKFVNNGSPLGFILFGWGLAGESMVKEDTSPVPSISIGRRLQCDPIPGLVGLQSDCRFEVSLLLWLDVRLALGPINDDRLIGPLLEFRTVLEAQLEDGRTMSFDDPFTDGTDDIQFAFVDDEKLPVHTIELAESVWKHAPEFGPFVEPQFRSEAEHCYFSWREVSAALLRALFDQDLPEQKYRLLPKVRFGNQMQDPPPLTRFSRASAAGAFAIDLLTGALEAELGAECDRLNNELDAFRAYQERSIRESEAKAIARWATKTTCAPIVGEEE